MIITIEIDFKMIASKFLLNLYGKLKRFPLQKDTIVAKLKIFDPQIFNDSHHSPSTIIDLAMHLPSLSQKLPTK